MLIEIFCQKLTVSNVILAFLEHLNLKFSFSADTERHLFSKSVDLPELPLALILLGLSIFNKDLQVFSLTQSQNYYSTTSYN